MPEGHHLDFLLFLLFSSKLYSCLTLYNFIKHKVVRCAGYILLFMIKLGRKLQSRRVVKKSDTLCYSWSCGWSYV